MDKHNKIILAITIVCTILVVGICVLAVMNHEKEVKEQKTSDSVKFKNEYESINGAVSGSNQTYPTVTLPDESTVKYVTEAEAVEILKNDTGIVYFGFKECPWCRTMISPLVNIANEYHVPIYYLDVLEIRSKYEVTDGEVNKTKEGTKSYYEILKLLDKHLDDYEVVSDDKTYETGEKRLYAPTVVAIKEGNIEEFHVGTVKSQKSGYDILTKKETDELNKLLTKVVRSVASNSCSSTGC